LNIKYNPCKKLLFVVISIFCNIIGYGQVVLNADGPGGTYDLITSVLAPGHNPIETPDCNHNAFGDHIDEFYDDDLEANVFRFHIHTTPDNDRCINFDRQRNEIKTYDQSPDNLLGIENEEVIYKWKFKLAAGFQSSPKFTHLHQLKSVGGPFSSMPMYTLTTRKGNPDELELRYAETDTQITLKETNISPFIDTWLEVNEHIVYGTQGTYAIEIKRIDDDEILFEYSNSSIVNWRPDAEFVRPKWGIYRSLVHEEDLRDEVVRFAEFSIEEVLPSNISTTTKESLEVYPIPTSNSLFINKIPNDVTEIKLINSNGVTIHSETILSKKALKVNVSTFESGIYILNLTGKITNQSKVILISH